MSENYFVWTLCLLKATAVRECNPGTRVPENPGNPPVYKMVNPGLCAGKNPGLTGLISGVSQYSLLNYTAQKSVQKRRALMRQNLICQTIIKTRDFEWPWIAILR